MAKILCVTSGLTGILNASFELVSRLKSLGHELIYASPSDVGERVRLQNIEYIQLPSILLNYDDDIPDYKGSLKKFKRLVYKWRFRAKRRKAILEKIEPISFLEQVEKHHPDLVILDVELHEYILRAQVNNIPFVLLSQWFSLWKRPGLPYLLLDTIPGKNWQGNTWKIALDWQLVKLKRWWSFTKKKLITVGTDRRSILFSYARKIGFDLSLIRDNFWPGPFLYNGLPVISMTASEMEFPHKLRPNYYNIGPMVFNNRKELRTVQIKTDKIESVIQKCKLENKALIYCSLSTLSDSDQSFAEKIIQAISNNFDWVLIMSTGKKMTIEKKSGFGENIFIFDFVPQLEVLQSADCSINHGGIHTINECIEYKVPMLIYSGKKSDQNGCAARVEYHKLGIVADKDIDSVIDVKNNIKSILANRSYKDKVIEMNKSCRKYKEKSFVSQIINPLLREKKMIIA